MPQFQDGPQLPLTGRRKLLVALGALMLAAQLLAAVVAAPLTTGHDNANAAALGALWAGSIPWSAAAVLMLVRQADLPDVATASFVASISGCALFALVAALNARGTSAETDLVDAIFLGVTIGAMTALAVWAIAMGTARAFRLPTTAALRDGE
jgi:hypothetical protein